MTNINGLTIEIYETIPHLRSIYTLHANARSVGGRVLYHLDIWTGIGPKPSWAKVKKIAEGWAITLPDAKEAPDAE